MQEVAPEGGLTGDLGRSAVEAVAHHGMADARQMYPDLVRTACADAHFKKREVRKTANDMILGPRCTATREPGSHADALPGIARDRFLDAAMLQLDFAMHQSEISFFYATRGELFGQTLVRSIVFRHQQHAAGIAIQAMHDAGPQFARRP